MKKQSRKLFSLLMVFALLGGLFCNVDTVNAQETRTMHQVTVSKDIAYGTIKCIIDFTYGLPSGQPSVNPQSYSTVPKNGYAIVITNVTKSQGDPTNITYSYSIYQNTVRVTTGYFRIAFYNNGTYNVLDY